MPAPGTVREPSITEASFLKSALLSSIRPDGRAFLDARPVDIRFGEELGWVDVTLGETRVLVSTHATLVNPRDDRPYEGFIEVRAEVQPIAGSQFERGRNNEEEILFERSLDRAIRRSDVIDRESLCVVAGYKVWAITLNIHLLSAQGSALDAAVLASIIALRHFRKADTTVTSRSQNSDVANISSKPKVIIHRPEERVPVPLALHHFPLSVSFAIFDPTYMTASVVSGIGSGANSARATAIEGGQDEEGMIILLDPTTLETTLSTSKLNVVANAQGEICVLDKAGGVPLSETVMSRVLGLARVRVKELTDAMDSALSRDSARRVIEVV